MVEAGATVGGVDLVAGGEAPSDEAAVVEGLARAKEVISDSIDLQLELAALVSPPQVDWPSVTDYSDETMEKVSQAVGSELEELVTIADRRQRADRERTLREETVSAVSADDPELASAAKRAFKTALKSTMRKRVVHQGIRLDGRASTDIRPLTVEVGTVERTHGSGLFQRGETQVLNVLTLGMPRMEQMLDTISNEEAKRYMHHYNFPPYCTGEAGFMRGPKRREIGHGALGEKALRPVLPADDGFQYTLRLVSEVLSSNGSSSMATVCGGTLAMMDAGVPIKEPVAGIAMGLIKEGDRVLILSDILGLEDHLGDMDFKVTGTRTGVTALQMDIKIEGITIELMRQALEQARVGRLHILEKMQGSLSSPRESLAPHAPRIYTIQIKTDKIRDVIGPGGKVIRGIIAECGVKVNVDDTGLVTIASVDESSARQAIDMINRLTEEAVVGKTYLGTVRKIVDFGAFVEILPNIDGLVHISQLAEHRVKSVADELAEGEKVLVKVLEIDKQGKIRLSRKEALAESEQPSAAS